MIIQNQSRASQREPRYSLGVDRHYQERGSVAKYVNKHGIKSLCLFLEDLSEP